MKIDKYMSKSRMEVVRKALRQKESLLKAALDSVIQGYTNAAFIYGPGGLGKTHLITSQLEAMLGKVWRHHTAYSTPKALMLAIAEAPDVVHLFEDVEKLHKTDVGASILRAACGSPKQRERWVTYETATEVMRVNFSGGIVIVSNEDLSRAKGPMAAVASRFRPMLWDLTTEERVVSIFDIAERGWKRGSLALSAGQCRQVAEYLVMQMLDGLVQIPVDLRTYTEHALPAFAMVHLGGSTVDWKEVVRVKLSGEVSVLEGQRHRSDRLAQLALAISLRKDLNGGQKVGLWKQETGLGQAIYYRHLRSAKSK
jgi:hypothetical protein